MFFSNKKLVAFDVGTSSVKMAEVDPTSKGPMLKKFGIFQLNPGAVEGGEILEGIAVSQAIEGLMRTAKSKRKQAVTGLWGNAVIVKKIAMPKMEAKLVAEQLKWEAEQYIPFDINEITLEHHIIGTGNGESMDVLLVAAKQDLLFRFLECIEAAQMRCAVMDVAGFALANCFEANYGKNDAPIALVNIGAGVTNFVVLERGEVVFNRDLLVGGNSFTLEINKSMGVSLQEAEALKISASLGQEAPDEVNAIMTAAVETVVDEIKNTFEFYTATANGVPASKFYVSGGSIFVPGLVESISKAARVPFEPLDPFQRVLFDPKAFTPEYIDQIKAISPVAVGLALRKAGDA